MKENKTILITGVAGLLGSRLADWLVENTNHNIVGVDDLSGGYIDNVHNQVQFHQFDLAENDRLEKLVKVTNPNVVYHLAAYAAEGLSPFMRSFNYKNNLMSTSKVINACINYEVERLVFTSTMAVYGHGNPPFDEEDTPTPIDPYGIAKYACEMDIQVAGEQHGLDWCIIRPHNVYGAKQNIWDKYRNVLGIWMYQYLKHEPLTIFGDGEQTRAFSYIDDSLEPLWNAAINKKASKQIINLGGIKEYPINEAAKTLIEVLQKDASNKDFDIELQYLEKRHEVKHSIPTFQKSIDLIGFEHKTDLKEGLTKMWDWVKYQPMKERFVWSEYELEKGIYSF